VEDRVVEVLEMKAGRPLFARDSEAPNLKLTVATISRQDARFGVAPGESIRALEKVAARRRPLVSYQWKVAHLVRGRKRGKGRRATAFRAFRPG
jgi:hypothetical protein